MGTSGWAKSEPRNLRRWTTTSGRLFTCGRPGRGTYGTKAVEIGEDTIDRWLTGLPEADPLHIVSLLGRKQGGMSEFSYYPFRSEQEGGQQPTFSKWLADRYGSRFVVHEFPTEDMSDIPPEVVRAASQRVRELVASGQTVVVVDSAGAVRSRTVCEAGGFREAVD